ncbi:PAS domain-containing protein [Minwuia sp.]|uniref:PAS domain-containing protein n=1 Tax=Minwuia sp. TaxID=2493630 RepID=UPI003A90524F
MKKDLIIGDADNFRRLILDLPPPASLGAGLCRTWDYWNRKRDGRTAPQRRDIDPIDMGRDLPGLVLYDVVRTASPATVRFRYRLTGSDTDRIHGRALKGHYVDSLDPPAFATMLHDDFSVMTVRRAPQLAQLAFRNADGNRRSYEALRLPLVDDQGQVVMIMVYANHGQPQP